MRPHRRHFNAGRSVGALVLLGMIGCAVSGCGPVYESGYPVYGYAPYAWGWGEPWGYYNPVFVVDHPWERHHDHDHGHHTEFYHGGGPGGGVPPGGVHPGGAPGVHPGGGGGHAGGGGGHR